MSLQLARVESAFIYVILIYFMFVLLFQLRTCVSVWMNVFGIKISNMFDMITFSVLGLLCVI